MDVLHDPANCGACGVRCDPNDVCANGACALDCTGGTTRCGNTCVELRNDPANCGSCGVSCGTGVCVNGLCTALGGGDGGTGVADAGDSSVGDANDSSVPDTGPPLDASTCPSGQTECGAKCVDTTNDPSNCGGCGAACMPLQVCSSSTCVCMTGATLCGGTCVDTSINPAHCGGCATVCAAGSVCTDGTCAAATSDWPMFGYDAQHSGSNSAESGVPPAIDSWSTTIAVNSNNAVHPVTVESGRAFVTLTGGFGLTNPLTALNVSDGSVLWTYNFGGVNSVGHPSVVGGKVYVQTNHGTQGSSLLWALDAATGTVIWSSAFGSQWENFWAPLVVGTVVYMDGGYYGGMYAFNVADGSQVFFNSALGQYDSWSPAYFGGDLYTFIDGNFSSEDPATGNVIATVPVMWNWAGYSMNTAPVFGTTYGYVIAPPNLVAIDPAKSAIAWTANGTYTATPAVDGNVVYGISAGNLIARDATTGALLATMVGDLALKYPPIVAGGYVYAASDANVYAWSTTSHAQAWTAPVGGWITIAARRLIVASNDGIVHGFVLSQ
ncbi:MAG TPA: PQQ-binding-like beta-propeller repeat protein [Polyangiaceae bacterium]